MIGHLLPSDSRSGIYRLPRTAAKPRPPATTLPDRVVGYLAGKRVFDVVAASILAVVLLPFIILFAALVVITSPGPAFYTQVRLGRFGKPFLIWKLRTMRNKCEDDSGAKWSTRGDTRVTWLGRILRKLHIDEFPQLWNVLRGDMSLVGPRPERPEFFPVLSAAIPDYAQRLLLKPGVTGLAQAYLPPDENIDGVARKQVYDVHYIRTVGFWLDVRLMLATVLQAGGVPHLVVRPMLALPTVREVEGAPVTYVNVPHPSYSAVPPTPLPSA